PVFTRQRQHQQQTDGNTRDWHKWKERRLERPVQLWIRSPHDEYGRADDDERKKCADVHQFRQNEKRQKRSHNSDEKDDQNRRFPRSPESGVNGAKEALWK